jgi:PBP4 family serine-type D-alanyl-D-alanine carboxypeptidase
MKLRDAFVISAIAGAASFSPVYGQTASETLARRIERIISRPEFRHALWGIEFYSLDKRQPLFTLNADKLFTAASTTKLLTEGTALSLLGADYRFRTRVYRTGPLGSDGTLNGDVVLVASGDPNLSGRMRSDGTLAFENEDHTYDGDPNTRAVPGDPIAAIRHLAQQVADRKIRKVTGHVVVDASLFTSGDRELGTGVVISPIMVNDNIVDVTITPGATAGSATQVDVSPATSYVRFVNETTSGAPGTRQTVQWASDSTLPDQSHLVTIRGSMPAGGQKILFAYDVPSPSRFAEVVFTEALRKAGVDVEARSSAPAIPGLSPAYTDANVIAEHVSAPMSEEVKVTLKVSQNLHASMTPRLLGAIIGKNDTSRTGFDLEREFLQRAGLDLSGAHQGDGAGGDAHFSPEFMVSYLAYMAKRPDYPKFLAALPILGKDGTLFDIQPASPAAGDVFAKTGTYGAGDPLNRALLVTAKGLAGYMFTADGRHLAFAIYVNNVSVPREPDAVKRIVGQALGELAAAAYDAQ